MLKASWKQLEVTHVIPKTPNWPEGTVNVPTRPPAPVMLVEIVLVVEGGLGGV